MKRFELPWDEEVIYTEEEQRLIEMSLDNMKRFEDELKKAKDEGNAFRQKLYSKMLIGELHDLNALLDKQVTNN